jgi:hypothetical protein
MSAKAINTPGSSMRVEDYYKGIRGETMAFNPNEHMRQLKSKEGLQDYLDVKWTA